MSQLIQMIICPFHLDTYPSLALYDNGTYYCFGCNKYGKIDNDLMGLINEMPTNLQDKKKRKIINLDKFKEEHEKQHETFLKDRQINVSWTIQHGLKFSPTSILCPVYNELGVIWGWQKRNLYTQKYPKKYILYPKQQTNEYPPYGIVSNVYPAVLNSSNKLDIIIVESLFDAYSLVNRLPELTGVVLLGTKLKNEVINFLKEFKPRLIWVLFDEDAAEAASHLVNRLNILGFNSSMLYIWHKTPYQLKTIEIQTIIDVSKHSYGDENNV